jgi:hypothetical protein
MDAHLLLVFGGATALHKTSILQELRAAYPRALTFGCSTAGEIAGTEVTDDHLVVTAVEFERTTLGFAKHAVTHPDQSAAVGASLARQLGREGLVHVFVLSDGLGVNGSELVRGLTQALPSEVTVTGGLSADGDRFQATYVLNGQGPETGIVGALGFYGAALRVGYGSLGGWDPFGPERLVTRSEGNVLYELDDQSALELYKTYLGEHAAGLPSTGLLFPLEIRRPGGGQPVVRTILAVDDGAQSMTFAGDVPEGSYARLMKANFDRLIEGAAGAAETSRDALGEAVPELALLISCVGRKLVLGQRIEEEVEGVRQVLGPHPVLSGFYSYGEISPFTPAACCELHNQTMTITTLREV